MPWLQVKVTTDAERAEAVEGLLGDSGAQAVSLEDAADQALLEPAPGDTPLWASVQVIGLFDSEADRDAIAAAVATIGGDGEALEVNFEHLPDRDWQRAWMADWHPMRFGDRLWVVPAGATIDEADAVTVHLDPGLAFGTGTHETTSLCLEWLDHADLAGRRILDFGCGSGILAIAALRLGAAAAVAADIDPQALEATRDNARRNGVAERLTVVDAAEIDAEATFSVIVANILAGPLIESATVLARRQSAGDRLVLAGILADQAEAVVEAYDTAYDMHIGAERDNWVRLEGRRRA